MELKEIDLVDKYGLFVIDDNYLVSEGDISDLESIFNQEACQDLFGIRKMDHSSISAYLDWAQSKYKTEELYLFLVRSNEGRILGGLDIQVQNDQEASIGFWKDQNSKVSMSSYVSKLLDLCRDLGYLKINAYTEPANDKARQLLERISFSNVGVVQGKTRLLVKYSKEIL